MNFRLCRFRMPRSVGCRTSAGSLRERSYSSRWFRGFPCWWPGSCWGLAWTEWPRRCKPCKCRRKCSPWTPKSQPTPENKQMWVDWKPWVWSGNFANREREPHFKITKKEVYYSKYPCTYPRSSERKWSMQPSRGLFWCDENKPCFGNWKGCQWKFWQGQDNWHLRNGTLVDNAGLLAFAGGFQSTVLGWEKNWANVKCKLVF